MNIFKKFYIELFEDFGDYLSPLSPRPMDSEKKTLSEMSYISICNSAPCTRCRKYRSDIIVNVEHKETVTTHKQTNLFGKTIYRAGYTLTESGNITLCQDCYEVYSDQKKYKSISEYIALGLTLLIYLLSLFNGACNNVRGGFEMEQCIFFSIGYLFFSPLILRISFCIVYFLFFSFAFWKRNKKKVIS